ncbi:MAG: peptide-methionine (S)-S-oxide reductase MsrA [Gammaproteobacteria bacterium]
MIDLGKALPGRTVALQVQAEHAVHGRTIKPPFPQGCETGLFAMGCFWGAERGFWELDGIYSTAVGYAGGYTPNPIYEEVCSGLTGHAEVVLVAYDPKTVPYGILLRNFWEAHDPTQGMAQGADRGTQYRSAIYTRGSEQQQLALGSRDHYQEQLNKAGHRLITTEISEAPVFFYAENYHQQYLAKNPGGYCGLGSTGVTYDPAF